MLEAWPEEEIDAASSDDLAFADAEGAGALIKCFMIASLMLKAPLPSGNTERRSLNLSKHCELPHSKILTCLVVCKTTLKASIKGGFCNLAFLSMSLNCFLLTRRCSEVCIYIYAIHSRTYMTDLFINPAGID